MSPRSLLPIFLLSLGLAVAPAAPTKVRFNEHIRPILSNVCFYCHGPDEKHREADLRLDTRAGALMDLGGYAAVVPGQPEKSVLLERVVSHDRDEFMPPPKSKKPRLTDAEVAVLRAWIEQGAEYEEHWAFLPLSHAAPPAVQETAWVKNPIDTFILARLEREGLQPSPEADRAALIRRLFLDLTGLLPTPEEVRAFTLDPRPEAYAGLVERLLASPHHGERWGRHWLDQARYADSNGYSIDSERAMWPYRDWVIKALNDDLPFDQFTLEQLAGDLLPGRTKNQLIASAFHRNTLINEEGGTKPEQFRVEAAIDRVNTTGAVWLGLTVGCAQCHTHKFDPIPHREFYELFAFFNQGADVNNTGTTVEVARGEIFGTAAPAEIQRQEAEAAVAKLQPEWEKRELARLESAPTAPALWSPATYLEYDTATGAGFDLLPDNSLLADGRGAFNDTYRIKAQSSLTSIAAVRLRVLTHEKLPRQGPGLASNGNFILTDFEAVAGGVEQGIRDVFADHEQPGFPAAAAVDDEPKSGWAINVGRNSAAKMNANHEIVFVFEKPVSAAAGPIEFKLHHDLNEKFLIGRLAFDFTDTVPAASAVAGEPLLAALRRPLEQRTPSQAKLAREAFARVNPATRATKAKKRDANADIVELMVMKDLEKARPTFLFQRGDFLRPDENLGPLEPGVLKVVAPALPAGTGSRTRIDLARWLVSPDHPLTPRVTMNRVWMRYFGRGIVETEEDFGAQGAAPTHPDLLDWLAREFIARRWSMKAMHRLIVSSATYRQSSEARPDTMEKDPRNLLLARQERLRVEAEIIRDAALSASGLLDPAIGGPSVFPPQPEGVYAFTQTAKKWATSAGTNRFRRALYTMFFRSAPYPLFTTFDAPDFQNVCTRRPRSNTPLQSLTLANDASFFEMAQGLAARVWREAPDVEARLRRAFELCLSREPSAAELALLRSYHDAQATAFASDAEAAKALVSKDFAASGEKLEAAAAMVCAARAILNTDSFITRE